MYCEGFLTRTGCLCSTVTVKILVRWKDNHETALVIGFDRFISDFVSMIESPYFVGKVALQGFHVTYAYHRGRGLARFLRVQN